MPRFSLRTLLLAVTACGLALTIWHYWPDPNNTLPIHRIVPADLRPDLSENVSPQPQIIVVREEAYEHNDRSYQNLRLALVNSTSSTLRYDGYPALRFKT